ETRTRLRARATSWRPAVAVNVDLRQTWVGNRDLLAGLTRRNMSRALQSMRCCYSLSSSALARHTGGIERPRDLAVFIFMTVSNLEGRWIGRSEGLAPFAIRST